MRAKWHSGFVVALLTCCAVPCAEAAPITFGLETVSLRHPTPFSETMGGVTAQFSSPQDVAGPAFSTQSAATILGLTLSNFSGQFVWPNNVSRDALDILFSQPVNSITLTFATIDYNDPTNDGGSHLQLTAFLNSTANPAVGSATAQGAFTVPNTYPQGTLSFNSGGQPFNLVRLIVPFQAQGATSLVVDNITINTVAQPVPEPASFALLASGLLLLTRRRRR